MQPFWTGSTRSCTSSRERVKECMKTMRFLQMEKTPRTQHSQEIQILCNDIFKHLVGPSCKVKDKIKTVLTKGIAGIGKTISVQKFILDWAEGKANQDVDFMFVLPFERWNLIKTISTVFTDFCWTSSWTSRSELKVYEECKVVFIFDGLDESRITLMFSDDEKLVMWMRLHQWVCWCQSSWKESCFPLLSSGSPPDQQQPTDPLQIHQPCVTEIQGFSDPQKEEYFKKRISDKHQASRIISHIRRSRSLHIMCHIPVFCWISANVLQNLLKQDESSEIPQNLTEMYIHFLLIQINKRNQKYEERDPEKLLQSNREVIVKLADLAFKQLMKGNVMFYEEDLKERRL